MATQTPKTTQARIMADVLLFRYIGKRNFFLIYTHLKINTFNKHSYFMSLTYYILYGMILADFFAFPFQKI